ncbi:MAG TPA: type III pantothenate kinase [SAR202 cluster bacterium]|jgi:type III pantothenate kinase|nr:type III pantothenate kinase [SAR202 cluster bacterium]MDP7226671.1 type III pantothenate kinase [SAR202 cluster bacterium]MDP7414649.1 type III pantothenate kinase [SAR202 cluster bacterium]MDP7533314.1 type III pantothenate kinase [SAR202 cluster bacterium]HJO81616.1 type III pantothenate kinase [SAR202 cluster bacterium]|tara:strand:+ start:5705 stop:6472 length:768 start_codon:yes stop_codon:yes gene_type:complete
MLLAIDIGNTNVTIGAFEGEDLRATFRLTTDTGRMPDEYALAVSQLLPLKGMDVESVDAVALCSVVPPLTPSFIELCEDYFGVTPLEIGAGTRTGVRVKYDRPRDVGADRIVDAAAALALHGGPAIVVDIGTATVFDAVTKSGDYLGGAIAPGIQIAADSLFHTTAQLRRVELTRPKTAIGKNTVHALQSGLVLGYADLVVGMVARFDKELGGGSKVIATGGLARVVADEVGVFDAVDPNLTLTGLRLIHSMNSD